MLEALPAASHLHQIYNIKRFAQGCYMKNIYLHSEPSHVHRCAQTRLMSGLQGELPQVRRLFGLNFGLLQAVSMSCHVMS